MKLITRDTDYALRALSFIARKDKKIVTVSELVKELKIPGPFLRKILQILNKKGISKSNKGVGGGFLINRPVERISLVDLMEVFQGRFSLNECLFKKSICPDTDKCLLKKKINNIEEYVAGQLGAVSVASLLKKQD